MKTSFSYTNMFYNNFATTMDSLSKNTQSAGKYSSADAIWSHNFIVTPEQNEQLLS